MLKSLPPRGKVLNEVKRMRGKCAAATRERVVLGSLALLSQRAGLLTASPEGGSRSFPKVSLSHEREAFLFTTYGRNCNFMVYYIG